MRHINLETWPRRDHFRLFNSLDYPYFSLCANVDLTAFYPFFKQRGISFTLATVYILTRAANLVPEFRYRIREGEVVEHEIVHPAITILTNEDLFTFCTFEYTEDFSLFAVRAAEQIACVKEHPTLEDEPGQDDLLFMTSIPWVSFTSAVHPINLHPVDSVPRIAWGKFFEDGESLKMPVGVQAHHALIDGIHVGKFYEKAQDYFSNPKHILGEN
ncbi:MAG: chloramphenicol acetyltransferase [Spirochaetota bacterium]|nr:MAG: chloramphenicol acetyltransferase [Spirochaetota bacterium]